MWSLGRRSIRRLGHHSDTTRLGIPQELRQKERALLAPSLREVVGAHSERQRHRVEVALDRADPDELHDLTLGVPRAETREDGIGNVEGLGDRGDVGEGGALALRKTRGRFEVVEGDEAVASEARANGFCEGEICAESAAAATREGHTNEMLGRGIELQERRQHRDDREGHPSEGWCTGIEDPETRGHSTVAALGSREEHACEQATWALDRGQRESTVLAARRVDVVELGAKRQRFDVHPQTTTERRPTLRARDGVRVRPRWVFESESVSSSGPCPISRRTSETESELETVLETVSELETVESKT